MVFDFIDYLVRSIFGNDFVVVEYFEFFGGIVVYEVEDSLGIIGVVIELVGEVYDDIFDNNLEIFFFVVFGNFFKSEFFVGDGESFGVGFGGGSSSFFGRGISLSIGSRESSLFIILLDWDFVGSGRIDVEGDLVEMGSVNIVFESLLEVVVGSRVIGNMVVDDVFKEGRIIKMVGIVDIIGKFIVGEEIFEGFVFFVENLGFVVDFDIIYGEVENGFY